MSGSGSRFRGAFATVGAMLCAIAVSTACAAGQQAQTEHEKPTLDGTEGSVGQVQIRGVAFRTPNGASYAPGASVPLMAYIANSGHSPDKLVKVSSPGFSGGWAVTKSGTSTTSGTSGSASAQTIPAGSAVSFGVGANATRTLVLHGVRTRLFPGMSVRVTFAFAQAGDATLTVPVQLSETPNTATLPAGPGTPTAG